MANAALQEIVPSSAVTMCSICHLTAPDQRNLILLRHNIIDIYSISADSTNISFLISVDIPAHVLDMTHVRLPRSATDSLALCLGNGAVSISTYREGSLTPLALYALEAPAGPDDGLNKPPRLVADPNGTCCAVLTHNRMLHIMPLSGGGEATEDGKDAGGVLWDDLLDDSPTKKEKAVEYPGTSKGASTGPPIAIDLSALKPPLRNIRDIVAVHGYSDPTFMVLHEPDQAWVGRVKMKQLDSGNVESKLMSCAASIVSFDYHKGQASVIWNMRGLPYNCTNLFAIPLNPPTYDLGGVLCFAANCLIHLSSSGPSFAAYVNRYGAEEVNSERNPFTSEEAIRLLPSGQKVKGDLCLELSNCSCALITPNRLLLSLANGDMYILQLSFSRRMMHSIEFLHLTPTERYCEPTCCAAMSDSRFVLGSTTGDSVLLECLHESGLKEEENVAGQQSVKLLARLTHSLCPLVDFDITTHANHAPGDFEAAMRSTCVIACSGRDAHSGSLTMCNTSVRLEVCSIFTLPSLTGPLTAVHCLPWLTRKRLREEKTLCFLCHGSSATVVVSFAGSAVQFESSLGFSTIDITLKVANVDNGIVQVTPSCIMLHDNDGEATLLHTWKPAEDQMIYDVFFSSDGVRAVAHVGDALVELAFTARGIDVIGTTSLSQRCSVTEKDDGILWAVTEDGAITVYRTGHKSTGPSQLKVLSPRVGLGDKVLEAVYAFGILAVRTAASRLVVYHIHSDVFYPIAHSHIGCPLGDTKYFRRFDLTGSSSVSGTAPRGLFMAGAQGSRPAWVFVSSVTGHAFVHSGNEEQNGVAPFSLQVQPQPQSPQDYFAVIAGSTVSVSRFPLGWNYTSAVPMLKTRIQRTPHFVAADTAHAVSYVVESQLQILSDAIPVEGCPIHRVPQYHLALYDRTLRRIDGVQLDEEEVVLCLNNIDISMDTEEAGGARYDSLRDVIVPKQTVRVVALGSGYPRGEDIPCRGRLLLVITDPQHITIDILHKEAMKGPVTAVSSCQAFVLATVGAKVVFYYFDWKLRRLITASFHSAISYVPKMVALRNYFLVTDAFNSITLMKFREDTHTMTPLARDAYPMEITSCEFFHDGVKELYCAACDVHGNLVFFLYQPLLNGKKGLLTTVSDTRVPGSITKLLRVNMPQLITSTLQPTVKSGLLYSTTTGALGIVTTLGETNARSLRFLYGQLCDRGPHAAGAHPKVYRVGRRQGYWSFDAQKKPKPPTFLPGVVDGCLLWQFQHLSEDGRKQIAEKIGTSVEKLSKVLADFKSEAQIIF